MSPSLPRSLGALALGCAALAHAGNDAFFAYGAAYRDIAPPPVGAGSFAVVGDNLADGRLVFATGLEIYVETAPRSGSFTLGATLDPALVGAGAIDPAFLTINPGGSKIAIGAGAGKPVIVFDAALAGSGAVIGASNAAAYHVDHYSAAWRNESELAIGAGAFGSPAFVSLLDTTSDPAAPVNPTIISNIGGASGGIAFDSAGRLFTANGFDLGPGGSGTGWIKAFDPTDWSGGPADFETGGAFIVDSLSAAGLAFDAHGNLFVGGADFADADWGAVAVFNAEAVALALLGGSIDPSDMLQARRLDPRGDGGGYYLPVFNEATGELLIADSGLWYATIPAPGASSVFALLGVGACGRRRRAAHPAALCAAPVLLAVAAAPLAHAQPFASRVVDYTPAPGQRVNNPLFNDPVRALGAPVGGGTLAADNSKVVTLGGFGGSITLAFDEPVLDDPRNPLGLDFIVYGNAFWAGSPDTRFAEPAVVEISLDVNGNGIADDPWYVIPGSSLPTPPIAARREQAWDNNASTPAPPASTAWYPSQSQFPGWPASYATATFELPPEFSTDRLVNPIDATAQGREARWGYADCSPTLLLGDTNGDNIVDDPSIAPEDFYTFPDDPRALGVTPGSGGGDAFDIAWAVDPDTGAPANLPAFHFVRISTAVDALLGPGGVVGESSAEISAVARVRFRTDSADLNGDGFVNSADLSSLLGAWGPCPPAPAACAADLNGDGLVNSADLSSFLGAWSAP